MEFKKSLRTGILVGLGAFMGGLWQDYWYTRRHQNDVVTISITNEKQPDISVKAKIGENRLYVGNVQWQYLGGPLKNYGECDNSYISRGLSYNGRLSYDGTVHEGFDCSISRSRSDSDLTTLDFTPRKR